MRWVGTFHRGVAAVRRLHQDLSVLGIDIATDLKHLERGALSFYANRLPGPEDEALLHLVVHTARDEQIGPELFRHRLDARGHVHRVTDDGILELLIRS